MGSKCGTGYTGRREWLEERGRESGGKGGRTGECQYQPAGPQLQGERDMWVGRRRRGWRRKAAGIRSQGQCHCNTSLRGMAVGDLESISVEHQSADGM